MAREGGAITSYDPNLRLSLWADEFSARAGMTLGLAGVNLVKLSEEELYFITGESELETATCALMRMSESIKLVFVSRGAEGCYLFDSASERLFSGIQRRAGRYDRSGRCVCRSGPPRILAARSECEQYRRASQSRNSKR